MLTGRVATRTTSRRRLMLAISYTALALACDNPLGPEGVDVGRVEVQPAGLTLVAGSTGALTARVYDASGKEMAGRRIFWSSQNAAVASVSATGIVSALSPGSVQIAANSGGKSAIASVTVNPRPVSTVRVTPSTASVQVGARTQLTVAVLDATGAAVPGKIVAWTSSSSSIASVSSTGEVTGVAAGSANVSATVDGVSGAASITVTAVPVASVSLTPPTGTIVTAQSIQLVATPLNAAGAPLTGRLVTWTSSDNAVATVSSTGLVVGLTPGRVTISAICETRTATSTITVTLVPVDTVSVSPSTTSVSAGSTVQLTVRLTDASGNILSGRAITYTSEQPAIASVNAAGLVTGLTQGQARITATSEGKSATALVTVSPVPISTLTVTPGTLTLPIAGTGQLTATPRDATGNVLPGRQVTWLSGAPSVATVSQTGLVTGVGAGSGVVFAAAEGISSSATITVATVPVATVSVTPGTSNLQQGAFVQLTATCRDASNNVLLGRTVTWSSSNQAVAVVSSTGRVTSIAPGSVTITATCDGVNGTAAVTVTAVPVATVTVTPNAVSIIVAQVTNLLATPRDAAGNILTGRTVQWSSSVPAFASVSINGDVTGVSAGTATITATIDGVTGSATVTVSLVPVASVTVAPTSVSINQGATSQLTATARDASNNVLTGRPITWTTSNASVATVSTTGLVTAVAPGAATITAMSGTASGSATVNVSAVPIASITVTPNPGSVQETGTVQLTATARDAANNILTGRTIVWSSNNPSVSVSQSGLVTAVANAGGQGATIDAADATAPATKGFATVNVSYLPVTSVSVTPPTPSVAVNGTTSLSATLQNGALTLSASGRIVTWSSSNTAVATVSAAGLVTAGAAPGTTTVTVFASSPGQLTPVSQSVTVTVSNVPVASVQVVQGPTATVHLGTPYVRTFTAITRDASNNVLAGRPVVWTSATQLVATVTAGPVGGGVVSGVAQGTEVITATSEGISGSTTVTVDLVTVSTVTVTPTTLPSLIPGASSTSDVQLGATPKDSAGNTISGAALGGRTASYTSLTPALATVTLAGGLVTAIGAVAGTAQIQVAYSGPNGGSSTVNIPVLAPVANVALTITPDSVIASGTLAGTATITDAASAPLAGRTISFASSNSARASVSAAGTSNASGQVAVTVTGIAAAAGPASANITATSETKTSAAVTVRTLNPVATVTVSAPKDSVIGTGTIQATEALKDAFNNTLTGRPIAWTTSNPAVATVSSTGLISVVGVGTATITATSEGQAGTSVVRGLAPVTTVALSANPATQDSLIVGAGTLATSVSLNGGAVTGRPVTYASSAPAVATVNSSTGVITAVAAGTTNVTATSEGVTSNALAIRVLPAITSITMAAAPADSLIGAGTLTVTATALVSGLAVQGRTLALSSSNTAIATVGAATGVTNPSGQVAITVTRVASGTANIVAAADGQTGTQVVRMLAPVSSVTLAASPATQDSIIVGAGTLATTVSLNGGAVTGRPVTYASGNNALATVSATGIITPVAAGTVNITATSEGITSNQLAVRILPAVSSVTLASSPSSQDSVIVGQGTLATTVSLNGGAVTGRPVTYASSNTAFATVSATGVITAVGVGGTVNVTATSEGVTSPPLAIRALPAVNTVTVGAPSTTMFVGAQQQATATLKDLNLAPIINRPVVFSTASSKVTITSAGLVTAVDSGSAQIDATSEGKVGSLNLTISLVPIGTVTLTPATATVSVGAFVTLTVAVKDAGSNGLSGRACTIATADATKATTTPNGIALTNPLGFISVSVQGVASTGAGTVNITATCEGMVATSVITVP